MSKNKIGIIAGLAFAFVVAVAPVSAACDLQHPAECTNDQLVALITQLLGQTGTGTGTSTSTGTGTGTGTGTITGIPAGFQFTTNLAQGTSSTDVKYLQILLNSDPDTRVATTGAGSPGNETTYYGALTKAAVIKFQNKYASEVLAPYGLTAGTGYFGATSRAKANALLAAGVGTGTGLPAGCTSTSGYSPLTGQPCSSGSGVVLPPGCTSTSGYSPTTGQPCSATTPVTGGFSVALASTNPSAGTLITGQAIADLLEFTINNGTANEVKITSVELTRLGVSADATLANVYLFDGAKRITDAATFSSGKATFNNAAGVIIVPANTAKTIAVKADILIGTQGQTVGVSLSGITSDATLSNTSLPIAGNIHNIAQANLATATFQGVLPNNTTSDPMDAVRVWEAQLLVGTRSVVMSRLTLQQINSIDSNDIKNFKLYIDGVEVATVANLDANRYLTFTFDKTLSTGLRTIRVLADITGGSGRTAQFSLRNKADVDIKDAEYNVSVSVGGLPATAGTIAINPGVMQVTKSTSSFSGKVPNNSTNVSLAKYTFKAYGEAIKVNTLTFGFTYVDAGGGSITNAACTLRNGKVYVNGQQVGSTADTPEAGHQFNTNFTVNAGETATVEFYADIFDADGTGSIENNDTITVNLLKEGTTNAEKLVSYGGLFVPENNSPANLVIVSAGALNLVKTTTFSDQNIVVPQATPIKIGSWDLIGSSVEDVNISTFTVDITQTAGGADFDKDNLKDVYLVYGGIQTAIKPTVNATNDWAVSTTIVKNQTMRIELYARIINNTADGLVDADDAFRVDLAVTGTGALSGTDASVVAVPGQTTTAKDGALVVSRDASTPNAAIVDDSGTVKTYSLKFEAQNDNYVIGELSLELNGTDSSAAANVILKDGGTILATRPGAEVAGPAVADIVFSGLQIPVNANTTKVLDVEVEVAPVGYGAGTSGAEITVDFIDAVVQIGSTGELGTVGTGVTDNTVIGNSIYVYKAIPTISLVNLPTTALGPGERTLSKFTIATNGTGTVAWKKIQVDVTKSSTAGAGPIFNTNSVKLYNADTGQEITSAVTANADCNDAAKTACTIVLAVGTNTDDNVEEVISGSKTYEIRATIGGTIATGDYITTQIKSSGVAHANGAAYLTVSGTNATFVWSDQSAQSHDTGTSDWMNDNLVKNLSLTSQTLTK